MTLENGWTGVLWIRRFGSIVAFVNGSGAGSNRLNGSAKTSDVAYTLPSGFRAGGDVYHRFIVPIAGGSTQVDVSTASLSIPSTSTTISTHLMFPTTEAWPTTLPGTQVTAPATLS